MGRPTTTILLATALSLAACSQRTDEAARTTAASATNDADRAAAGLDAAARDAGTTLHAAGRKAETIANAAAAKTKAVVADADRQMRDK